jgi:cytochrome d ubiquinol oxidase subunit II
VSATVESLLTLPMLVAAAILVSLNVYVLLGGADFGGGVWDLLASGPRRDQQRELVSHAIAPIWEANHVWLILVIVLLFTGFPAAFARLSIQLHIPLTLMLVGIVLRGSAFTFRSYDDRGDAVQRRWGRVFAIASTATPVLLGTTIGTIAAGSAGPMTIGDGASFADVYVWPWLSAFTVGIGLLALALFAFLAAVYLTVEATDNVVREDFRRRALAAGFAVFAIAFTDLSLAGGAAPALRTALTSGPLAMAHHLATGAAAAAALIALWRHRFRLARVAAAAQVSLILWGWALGQYPLLVPPDLTIEEAAAPRATLLLLMWALVAGLVVLVPSLRYLFRVFKGEQMAKRM